MKRYVFLFMIIFVMIPLITQVCHGQTPTPTDTPEPTATPTATDTPEPTATPTATDTPEPTATPTATDTPTPTDTPTMTPTDTPTATPTDTPTPTPSPTAISEPGEGMTVSATTATTLLDFNASRTAAWITNTGGTTIWVKLGIGAAVGDGIPLPPFGKPGCRLELTSYKGRITAIAQNRSSTASVSEL